MKILIVGAGVIGVTSAWYLAKAGHEVIVLEQGECAGGPESASHANGGQLSVAHSSPWAAPGVPVLAVGSFWQKNSPLRIRPDFSKHQTKWMLAMLKECNAASYSRNRARMLHLSAYSRRCLHELQEKTGITFEMRKGGILQIYQTPEQMKAAQAQSINLEALRIAHELLTPDDVLAVEPGLKHAKKTISGGLRLTEEESGDCQLFTQRLAQMAADSGVQFHYGVTVEGLIKAGDRIEKVLTKNGEYQADAYVIAAGAFSHRLLRGILDIPVYPVKGYSVTATILRQLSAPQHALLDVTGNVAIARFDNRVRVAGFAEVVGYNGKPDKRRYAVLKANLESWFPDSTEVDESSFWAGLRPSTPDGAPLIGETPLTNLYLNTGHGTLGWTMSCGSAQVLADVISNKPNSLADELALDR